jgi:DNA-binding IscR family transcriptional regulator
MVFMNTVMYYINKNRKMPSNSDVANVMNISRQRTHQIFLSLSKKGIYLELTGARKFIFERQELLNTMCEAIGI